MLAPHYSSLVKHLFMLSTELLFSILPACAFAAICALRQGLGLLALLAAIRLTLIQPLFSLPLSTEVLMPLIATYAFAEMLSAQLNNRFLHYFHSRTWQAVLCATLAMMMCVNELPLILRFAFSLACGGSIAFAISHVDTFMAQRGVSISSPFRWNLLKTLVAVVLALLSLFVPSLMGLVVLIVIALAMIATLFLPNDLAQS